MQMVKSLQTVTTVAVTSIGPKLASAPEEVTEEAAAKRIFLT